jgi:methylenetetrahydrofolate--tRNA-(uracil-5-)-methyltransferase
MEQQPIQVIGGLAGTEAAWQIANAGLPVVLHEMRPKRFSPAHHSEHWRNWVCSNSFGAMSSDRAACLLHEELRRSQLNISLPKLTNTPFLLVVL